MFSRKQLLVVVVFGILSIVAIIIGSVVGTQVANSSSLSGGSTTSLLLCTGEPCIVTGACRSSYGFCGIGVAWCNDKSTWRPEGCIQSIPQSGKNCSGEPCLDKTLCRSEFGFCGNSEAYCNPKSIWNPNGCGDFPTNSPTISGTTVTTKSPTSTSSSVCSGAPCPSGMCRSEWNFCGSSPAYCNSKSTFTPTCPGGSTSSPNAVTTNSPTNLPTSNSPTSNSPTFLPTTLTPTESGATLSPSTAKPTIVTSSPISTSSPITTPSPTRQPTTKSPTLAPKTSAPFTGSSDSIIPIIQARQEQISSVLLQYQTPTNAFAPSNVYKAKDLLAGVQAAVGGIAGMTFISNGVEGKLNIAAFLAQSMKETIKYDVCDENNWDLINGVYPASNACGQLGQSYSDYSCGADEKFMECPLDLTMEKKAATNAGWYGAPGPLFCAPKSIVPKSPGWNYGLECNQPWATPPKTCTDYPGQKAGGFDFSKSYPNAAGRTDVEGCCWWGRGVIQLTGRCNVGKLNYFLGKGAADRGVVNAPFPDVDFCTSPDAICASTKYPELKWVSGLFYWMRDVQAYNAGGWTYQAEIAKVAANPNDASLRRNFINGVSGIVNRGSPFAGNVDGGSERAENFEKAWAVFGPSAVALSEGGTGEVIIPAEVDTWAIAGGILGAFAFVGIALGFIVIQRKKSKNQLSSFNPIFERERAVKN